MNKYQEALMEVEEIAYKQYEDACYNKTTKALAMEYEQKLKDNTKILQELVDKQKPAKMLWNAHGFRKCGYCDNLLHLRNLSRYCDVCGQKIDWGEDDE